MNQNRDEQDWTQKPQESEESIVREIISDGNGSHEEED